MNKIRLKRKQFRGQYAVIAPSWISNGFWAIRKHLVTNVALFASAEVLQAWLGTDAQLVEKTDADISKFFAGERKEFRVTRVQAFYYAKSSTILVADGECSFLDPKFLGMFSLSQGDVLYARGGEAPLSDGRTEEESTIVLMPKRQDDKADIAKDLQRWLAPVTACEASEPQRSSAVSTAVSG
jgi:hypothetical protein